MGVMTTDSFSVRKIGYQVTVQVDDDGTPVVAGERWVEIRPGEWAHPVAAACEELLDTSFLDVILDPARWVS